MKFLKVLLVPAIFALVCETSASAAEKAKNVQKSPSITINQLGTLTLKPAQKGKGYLANFTPIRRKGVRPFDEPCSGSCGDWWSGSWSCADGDSCYLDCSDEGDPGQCVGD